MGLPDHLIEDGTDFVIKEDSFGWFCIMQGQRQLQAFRTISECQNWIRDIRPSNYNIEIQYQPINPKF